MAKQVQLKQNGVEIYPQTITQAIADVSRGKLLSSVLNGIEAEALSWEIKPMHEATTTGVTYGLYYTPSGGTETLKSQFAIAQDIYLDNVFFYENAEAVPSGVVIPSGQVFPAMRMVFNTASGAQDIWVALKGLVETYEADGKAITIETLGATDEGIITFNVSKDAGNILEVKNDGAFVSIGAQGDTYVSATLSGDSKTVVVATDVITTSGDFASVAETGQLVDAKAAKEYIDAQVIGKNVDAESKSPEYITATAANNKVTVSAMTGTITGTASALTGNQGIADAAAVATAAKAYVDGRVLAEKERVDALTAGQSGSTDYIEVQVSTLGGNVNGVSVSNQVATDFSTVTSTDKKLADAYAIKSYVDSKTGDLDAGISGHSANNLVSIEISQVDGALNNVALTAVTHSVSDAAAGTADGLATAANVKTYVDDQISGTSISAQGDTYIGAAVDASNNKKINVSANTVSITYENSAITIGNTDGLVNKAGAQALVDYIDEEVATEEAARIAAINALNADKSGQTTDTFITVQVVEQSGVVTNVNVTDKVQAISTASSASTATMGLAEASAVKEYVDGKVTASTILDSADIDATETASGTTLAIKYGSIASGAASAVTGGDIFEWGVTADIIGDAPAFTWPS